MTTRTGRTHRTALVLAAALLSAAAAGAAPSRMSFQGKLLDAANNPRDGSYDFTFRVFDQAVGGTERWSETQTSIQVVNGAFAVQLGAVTPLSTGLFTGTSAYLEVTVEPDPPMSPRQLLLPSAYAFRASLADDLAPGNTSYVQVGTTLQPNSVFVVSSATIQGPLQVTKTSTFTASGNNTYSLVTASGILVLAGNVKVAGAGGLSATTSITASTLTASSGLILPMGSASSIEGSVRWQPDLNLLYVGTGTANKTMVDTDSYQTLRNKTLTAADNVLIDATSIQGRTLATETPEDGNTMKWDVGAQQWRPVFNSTITVVSPPFAPIRTSDTVDLTAGTIYIVPFFIPGTLKLNQIRYSLAIANPATGDAGLYDTSGVLVAHCGSGAINFNAVGTQATVVQGAPKTIQPGQYFLAMTSNGTPRLAGVPIASGATGVVKGLGTLTGGGAVLPNTITISSIVDGFNSIFMSLNE